MFRQFCALTSLDLNLTCEAVFASDHLNILIAVRSSRSAPENCCIFASRLNM